MVVVKATSMSGVENAQVFIKWARISEGFQAIRAGSGVTKHGHPDWKSGMRGVLRGRWD
jgi:hypothetical protein